MIKTHSAQKGTDRVELTKKLATVRVELFLRKHTLKRHQLVRLEVKLAVEPFIKLLFEKYAGLNAVGGIQILNHESFVKFLFRGSMRLYPE